MHDLGFHALLFFVSTIVIVAVSCMFSEPEDAAALRLFPRRLARFLIGSAIVLGVMLALEHTLAAVS